MRVTIVGCGGILYQALPLIRVVLEKYGASVVAMDGDKVNEENWKRQWTGASGFKASLVAKELGKLTGGAVAIKKMVTHLKDVPETDGAIVCAPDNNMTRLLMLCAAEKMRVPCVFAGNAPGHGYAAQCRLVEQAARNGLNLEQENGTAEVGGCAAVEQSEWSNGWTAQCLAWELDRALHRDTASWSRWCREPIGVVVRREEWK